MDRDKKNLINWARSCHYDGCIAIKEIKGKRWMSVLSYLQVKFEFDIDDENSFDDSWTLILKAINSCDSSEINHLNNKRRHE